MVKSNDELLKELEAVIEQAWNHVTPGTPDYAQVQHFKNQLRAVLRPPAPAAEAAPQAHKNKAES